MAEKIDDLLPTAKEIQKQAALKEAEKAEQDPRRLAAAEAEKRALVDRLREPSGLTEDEKVKLAAPSFRGLCAMARPRFRSTDFPIRSAQTTGGLSISRNGAGKRRLREWLRKSFSSGPIT